MDVKICENGNTNEMSFSFILLKRTEAIFQFLAMRLKMHAIPNFSTVPTVANFREILQSVFKQYICKSGVAKEEAKFVGK